jgi:hypothetical protein
LDEQPISFKQVELKRHQVIERSLLGKLTNQEASDALGVSIRQVQFLKKELSSLGS